jgi:uncharacterized protein YjbI with pentapeptide repeats
MSVKYLRAAVVAGGAVLTISFSIAAFAANPKDIARARDTRGIADCTKCDLTNANMAHGFFQFANMISADLSGANFDGANMAGVQLNNAKAIRASFIYTNFSGARLDGADLSGANFSNAWLNWTWLTGAKLDGANFAGARMPGAQLYGTDLSKAVGITQDQIDKACGDASTKLPPGIRVPACVVNGF